MCVGKQLIVWIQAQWSFSFHKISNFTVETFYYVWPIYSVKGKLYVGIRQNISGNSKNGLQKTMPFFLEDLIYFEEANQKW